MDIERFRKQSELVFDWAVDRGILEKGTPIAQQQKTIEEIIELKVAYIIGNDEELIDAIGDVTVTLIIQAFMQDLDIVYIVENTPQELVDRNKLSINLLIDNLINNSIKYFDLLAPIQSDNNYLEKNIINSMYYLNKISEMSNLNIQDCLDTAYNVISNRKGKMINGTFVKEK